MATLKPKKPRTQYAFVLSVTDARRFPGDPETNWDLVANVVRLDLGNTYVNWGDDGIFRNPDSHAFMDPEQIGYADFRVESLLSSRAPRPYAANYGYAQVYRVDLRRVEAMAKLLRRIDRGLTKLTRDRGYQDDYDFAGYLLRVAEVLGIKRIYVTNDAEDEEWSGAKYRGVSPTELQSWVHRTVRERAKKETAE